MDLEDQLVEHCRKYNLDEVRTLIKQGANIHVMNDYPLRWTALNGHLDIVKYLVSIGADIHTCNDAPLRNAAFNGHYKVVSYLLTKYPTYEKQSLIQKYNLNNLISKQWIQYFRK